MLTAAFALCWRRSSVDLLTSWMPVCHLTLAWWRYHNRHHLKCWRVPAKVQAGLPDPDVCTDPATFEAALLSMNEVLISGLSELSADKKNELVRFAMVKKNWAGYPKKDAKRKRSEDDEGDPLPALLYSASPLPFSLSRAYLPPSLPLKCK